METIPSKRRVRPLGIPLPSRWEGVSRSRPNVVQRHGLLVARDICADQNVYPCERHVGEFSATSTVLPCGEVLVKRALRDVLGWRTSTWWRNRSAWCMKKDPANVTIWKHSDVEVGGRRERLDAAYDTRTALQGRCDGHLAQDNEAASGGETTEGAAP